MDKLAELIEKTDQLIGIVTAFTSRMATTIRDEIHTARRYFDTQCAARLLNLAPYTVRQKCNLGKIRAERSNVQAGPHGRWVISREELDRYLKEGDRQC